jgi:hypothetical protein
MEISMKSELELLIEYDMYECGFDASDAASVEAYWEMMLS